MEQITIQISDRRKARALKDFLKSLDYVEKIKEIYIPLLLDQKSDFFAMAGIWESRDNANLFKKCLAKADMILLT